MSAANSCNFITSHLILCALVKALATRHKALIDNLCFFWIFFSRYFSVSHCDGGMIANVTTHGLKVQNNPSQNYKTVFGGFLSQNQLEIQIFTINVL